MEHRQKENVRRQGSLAQRRRETCSVNTTCSLPCGLGDERSSEVLATGLPIQQGAQLAVDITSPWQRPGSHAHTGATTNGAALQSARHLKEANYSELLEGDRCRLVVIGVETGGRFSQEAVEFVDALAAARARDSSSVLRRSAHLGLATPVDADVGHLMWPFVRCFAGRGPERRVVGTPDLADLSIFALRDGTFLSSFSSEKMPCTKKTFSAVGCWRMWKVKRRKGRG